MGDFEGGQPKKKNLQVEPGAGPSSLFILSDTNFIRRFTLFLIEWPPFEYTILLTIIGNIHSVWSNPKIRFFCITYYKMVDETTFIMAWNRDCKET